MGEGTIAGAAIDKDLDRRFRIADALMRDFGSGVELLHVLDKVEHKVAVRPANVAFQYLTATGRRADLARRREKSAG